MEGFSSAEQREKAYLIELLNSHFKSKIKKERLTDIGSYDDFDCYLTGCTQPKWTSNNTYQTLNYTYVIEAKVWEQEYPEMILEVKKLKTITQGRFLYNINSLPAKTLIWRIRKNDEHTLKKGKMKLPITTMGYK